MAGSCFLCANWYRMGTNADATVQEKELSDLKLRQYHANYFT